MKDEKIKLDRQICKRRLKDKLRKTLQKER